MDHEFFKYLPSEIVIDILSRLPVRTIISCKCVQKLWLHLVETQEFVKSHLSKSPPGLIIFQTGPTHKLQFFEFEDGLDVENHDLHYKPVTKFNHFKARRIMGSVDGLLFVCRQSKFNNECEGLYICNPITRDYINLHYHKKFRDSHRQVVTYGFGSSKMTSQYKVVRIFHDFIRNKETQEWQKSFEAECYVYTLGTRSWRRHAPCALLEYRDQSTGTLANGKLHWLVLDLDLSRFFLRISCFDLETEQFSFLGAPPLPWNGEYKKFDALSLFVWGDCLGLCDISPSDQIVLWLMKQYGVQQTWTRKLVISNVIEYEGFSTIGYPIKVFKDGDILIQWNEIFIYYSSKTKTTQKVDMFELPDGYQIDSILHTPSFLSLESFGLKVRSF